jgi:hypothetical protein
MAEPIVRSFVIDTTESEQNLKELNTQINATSTAVDNTAQSFENVSAAEQSVTASSKSLKAQLRELQAQLAATDPDSAKYRELAAAAGELKDRIQDAAQAVGTQAGGAFERVGGSLGLVTSRIASLDFTGAAEGAKQLAVNIGQIKPGDIANGVKSIGSAFVSVGKALLTNPIFLVGAAIAGAIAYSEELLALVDGISSAEQERLATQQESAKASKEQLDAISSQENILKLAGKSEREILNLKIAAAQQAIIDQKAVIATLEIQRQQQIDAAKRNADITKGILQFLTAPLQLLIGAVDYIIVGLNKVGVISDETLSNIGSLRENFNQAVTGLIFDPEEVAKEGDKSIEEAKKVLQGLENTQAGFQLSIKQMNQKAADDKAAAVQKEKDAAIKAQQEVSDLLEQLYAENVAEFEAAEKAKTDAQIKALEDRRKATEQYYDLLSQLQDQQFESTLTDTEKEELAVTQKYEKLFAAADAAGISTVELQKQLAAEILAIQQKSAADGVQTTENEEAKKVATRQEGFKKGLDLAANAIQVLQAFSDASTKNGERDAKKKFKTDKALAIGAATVQTASAVTGALTAGGNPIKLATGAQFVEAGIAAALGLAQIIKIKNSQFGGTGGSDSPPSTSVPSTPDTGGGAVAQFNPLAGLNIADRPEQVTPRAYVLAGDVASQQEVRQKVEDLSRIG